MATGTVRTLGSSPILEAFSPREKQIIHELLEARSVKEIATQLHLSVNTVKDYLKTVYQKAQVHSARELLVKLYVEKEADRRTLTPAAMYVCALEQVMDATTTEDAVGRMLGGVGGHVGAGQASFWIATREIGEWLLSGYPGLTNRVRTNSSFIQTVVAAGFQHVNFNDPLGIIEKKRLEAFDPEGEIVGVRVRLQSRTGILLVTHPVPQAFSEEHLMALRVIARVTEIAVLRLTASMAASA